MEPNGADVAVPNGARDLVVDRLASGFRYVQKNDWGIDEGGI